MAFIPVPNILEVFIEHTFNAKPNIGWVVHYESTAPVWTESMVLDCLQMIIVWWNAEMKPCVTADVALTRVRGRVLTTATSGIGELTGGLPINGTRSGASMPANVAFSLKKNTGLAGKNFRGRIYQFGMAEADVSQNFVTTGYALAVQAAWTEALLLTGDGFDYGMVLASKYTQNAPRPSGIATDVTSISYADLRVDTRRDRL